MTDLRFRVLVADPGWLFNDSCPGKGRGASKKYRTQHLDEIRRQPLLPMEDDCVLALWRVAAMVEEAYTVVRAWGFTPKAEVVWAKERVCRVCKGSGIVGSADDGPPPEARYRSFCVGACNHCGGSGYTPHLGMGHQVRNVHETFIIATRGKGIRIDKGVPSLFRAVPPTEEGSKRTKHSAKPPEFYRLIERLYPGPYFELHARVRRHGWAQVGDELPPEEECPF